LDRAVVATEAEVRPPKSKRRLWAIGAFAVFAIAAGAVYWFLRPRTPVVTGINQLTHTGLQKQGAWFYLPVTDGTRIYFDELKEGKWHIAQVSPKGGEVSYLDLSLIEAPFIVGISEDGFDLLLYNLITGALERPYWLVTLPDGPAQRILAVCSLQQDRRCF
jgi:hypothetical protein